MIQLYPVYTDCKLDPTRLRTIVHWLLVSRHTTDPGGWRLGSTHFAICNVIQQKRLLVLRYKLQKRNETLFSSKVKSLNFSSVSSTFRYVLIPAPKCIKTFSFVQYDDVDYKHILKRVYSKDRDSISR